jgi:hypothetical protein
MKQKLNVKLIKSGSENDILTRLIANMNEGKAQISPRDLEGYLTTRNATYPTISNCKLVKDEDEPNTYHVSENGGFDFTMSLEWVEIHELPEVDKGIEEELNPEDDLKEVFN